MSEKKKMGRPSQGKVWRSYTIDSNLAYFIDALPPGKRSQFVNEAIFERVEEIKAQREYAELKGE